MATGPSDIDFKVNSKLIIGMIHVDALPGTPRNQMSVDLIARKAKEEAIIFQNTGVDAIMIENMHDTPYLNQKIGPEIVAAMSVIANEIKSTVNLPLGIQILAGANKEALAVAHAVGMQFIRAEGFVFSHIADEGLMNSCAAELLRYRKAIGAEHIKILTDVKKKHSSHTITSDVSLEETAKAAQFFLSDGVVITGNSTGVAVEPADLAGLKSSLNLPVIIGSGITTENIDTYWNQADAFIVGSHFKASGHWTQPVNEKRVSTFMNTVQKLRQ